MRVVDRRRGLRRNRGRDRASAARLRRRRDPRPRAGARRHMATTTTIPGAACDVPSHLYSFSFAQRRDWPRLCSPRDEILGYLREVAREHGVDRLVVPRHGGRALRVRRAAGRSRARDGRTLGRRRADRRHRPAAPHARRRASTGTFAGHSFHSAEWDHGYDLRGKRVAVIGTGASAVQFVPEIAEQVEQARRLPAHGQLVPAAQATAPYPRWFQRAREGARRAGVPAPVHVLVRRVADADDPPPAHAGAGSGGRARRCSCAGSCATASCAARSGRTTRSAASGCCSARGSCPRCSGRTWSSSPTPITG